MTRNIVPNPFQFLYKTLFITGIVLYIPAIFTIIWLDQLITVYIGLAQTMLFFTGIIFLIKGKQDIRGIQTMLQSEILAHWIYDQSHWKTYSNAEYKRQKQNAYSTLIAFFAAGLLLGWTGYKGMMVTDGLMIGAVLGFYSFAIGMVYAKSVLNHSEHPPFEAFISPTSAYINGIFIDWSSPGITLRHTSIANDNESGVRSLLIKYSVRGKYGGQEKEMYVPIPDGCLDVAANVTQRLQQQIQ